jgi:hypothetical protein
VVVFVEVVITGRSEDGDDLTEGWNLRSSIDEREIYVLTAAITIYLKSSSGSILCPLTEDNMGVEILREYDSYNIKCGVTRATRGGSVERAAPATPSEFTTSSACRENASDPCNNKARPVRLRLSQAHSRKKLLVSRIMAAIPEAQRPTRRSAKTRSRA